MNAEDLLLDDSFLAWYFKSDQAEWERWELLRNDNPILTGQMDEAARVIEAIVAGHVVVSVSQQAAANARLKSRIQEWERSNSKPLRVYTGRRKFLWGAVAASVSLVAILGYWMGQGAGESKYIAEKGQTKRVELPDGSVVKLNGGSTLKTRFEDGEDREVWLTGEGYFEVSKHGDGRKFVVHTEDLDVVVLGTQFNVKGASGKTEVVLEEGKVQVGRSDDKAERIIMEPGEIAEYSKASGKLTKRDVNTKIYTSWREGKIVFENAGIAEIERVFQDVFGIKVEMEEGAELGEFNGVFPLDDPSLVVTALEKAYPGRIIQSESTIKVKK